MKIALVGYARTGKDTVCQMIQDYLQANGHGNTKRLAFADEMKNRLYEAFPELYLGKKPREIYETFGELGRSIDSEMWIRPVSYELKLYNGIYENFVITDVRQPNEAKWARENGFTFIKVWCPPNTRKERAKGDYTWKAVNPSEDELHIIQTDYIIFNMFDFENLKDQVKFIIEKGLLKNER